MKTFRLVAIIFLISLHMSVFAEVRTPLKLCFEDAAQRPWTMPDGSGLNIELLRKVELQIGERFELSAKPWKRCLEEVKHGVIDGYFGAAYSEERQIFSVFPSLADGQLDTASALNEDVARVFIDKNSAARWDGKRFRGVSQAILVQRGYLVGDILREQGEKIREIRQIDEAFDLLIKQRAEVAILQGIDAYFLTRHDQRYKDRIEIYASPFVNLPMFLAFSRTAYTRDANRIQAIWAAIKTIRQSSSYQLLLEAASQR
ncbi:substrate-binding periplasmic protein [Undibacterium fentianense]|uniref:Transporter substrate-binding domain-containing protein n=1 Tax=Undibacterium fentianense TaxID=2828728 RepID=A0A941DYI1_9BURK|nr:transporter substrate-binding domain-containing protein [Undibacterium fentianense]MBR7799794.1 transporter substrate-binding domain-containing protein [Undibacterium fentianense]